MMKTNRGGKRKGAGRKPAPYKTTTVSVRVRTEWVEPVKEAIKTTVDKLKKTTDINECPKCGRINGKHFACCELN